MRVLRLASGLVVLSLGYLFAQTLSLSPSSVDFQNQTVSTTSPAKSVTLTNTGSSAANLASIAASGDFTRSSTCPLSADDFNRADGSLGSNWARADANLGGGFSIRGNPS